MSGAVSWQAAEGPRAGNVDRDQPTTLGRAEGADVRLDDSSVSREQAAIRFDGTSFRVANRSSTNPTRVNGQRVEEETALRDQDELVLGAVNVRFHDLGAHDSISGPICSHCGRENKATDSDCWFCGTSLVSAASTLRKRRQVVGRLVADDGEFLDLYEGQSASLGDGPPVLRQEISAAGAAAEVSAGEGGLSIGAPGEAMVNGATAGASQALQTGDVVQAGGQRYLVIVRR